jgi:hypothetical protein
MIMTLHTHRAKAAPHCGPVVLYLGTSFERFPQLANFRLQALLQLRQRTSTTLQL